MKIYSLVLATSIGLVFPLSAQAESEQSVSRSCGEECSQLSVIQTNDSGTDLLVTDTVAQGTRIRRVRNRRGSSLKRFYIGGTLGLFFPSELEELVGFDDSAFNSEDFFGVDPGTGVGGSLYGGYRFSDFIGADLEAFLFFGGADVSGNSLSIFDDEVYASVGIFANPRFTIAFDKNNINKSPYAYISPGLGIVSIAFSDEIGDRLENVGLDSAGAGIALQGKAGVGYPFSETLDVFAQARYFRAFNVFSEDDSSVLDENQSFSSLGLELGLNLKF